MSSHAVVVLPFSHGLLGGLPALLHFRRSQGQDEDAPVTVIAWPPATFDDAKTRLLEDALARMLTSFHGIRVWAPPRSFRALARGLPGRFEQAARTELGTVSELFYPHESSRSMRRILRAFPDARRICFGDGFGTVFTASDLARRVGSPLARFMAPLRAVALSLFEPIPAPSEPEIASLLVPCDLTGDFLRERELCVPPVELAREVAARLGAAVPELALHQEARAAAGVRHLLLLGDYAEAGLSSDRSEEDLYADIADHHVPPGAPLLLKPHPGTLDARLERVARRLGETRPIEILPEALRGLPVELARPSEGITVLSLSYATISLRYLYGAPIEHVLDDRRVERYFLPARREWVREMNDLYVEMASRLAHWNGRGLLWSAPGAPR